MHHNHILDIDYNNTSGESSVISERSYPETVDASVVFDHGRLELGLLVLVVVVLVGLVIRLGV